MEGINKTLYGEKNNKEEVLTKEEVMKKLHIKNPRTFMKLINEQRLPYIKIGRKYCVLESDLYRWLKNNSIIKV